MAVPEIVLVVLPERKNLHTWFKRPLPLGEMSGQLAHQGQVAGVETNPQHIASTAGDP
jgi:hypothetical protein